MANPEHLAILEQGVQGWNQWREHNPQIVAPDLSGANLTAVTLAGASLVGADLTGAALNSANLTGSNLTGANLTGANLIGADLIGADLSGAKLTAASLISANLRGANLTGAYLIGAYLIGADLGKADLSGADLSGADLSGADLQQADIQGGRLYRCNLAKARLTGAKLYAAARDGWTIDDVDCRYVFWDANGEVRSPREGDFASDEFERLYRTLPTIEYVFPNGITPLDPLIMDRVVQGVRERNPEFDIRIDSISTRGLAPSVRFTVLQEEHKGPALAEVSRAYEAKNRELADHLDEARAFIQLLIDRPDSVCIEKATGQHRARDGRKD